MVINANVKKILHSVKTSRIAIVSFIVFNFLSINWNLFPPITLLLLPLYIITFILAPFSVMYLIYGFVNILKEEFDDFFVATSKVFIPLLISIVVFLLTLKIGEYQFVQAGRYMSKLVEEYEQKEKRKISSITELDKSFKLNNVLFYWYVHKMELTSDGRLTYPNNVIDRHVWNFEEGKWEYQEY